MQKGIRESAYLEEYLCDNHTLQLSVKDTFDEVIRRPGVLYTLH